jgi:replicative DNA helicase
MQWQNNGDKIMATDFGAVLRNGFDLSHKFRPLRDRYELIQKETFKERFTGIPCIDDATAGIVDTDLFVIGSSTGMGKTTIATTIAMHNAMQGMKTYMFALEAYNGEIEDRIKFAAISQFHYENVFKHTGAHIRYKEWKKGKYAGTETDKIEQEVIQNTDEKIKENLHIRYRENESYNVDDFDRDINILSNRDSVDLVIIDHLHYFDYDSEKETPAISKIVKRLRDIGLFYHVPIVLISHLRKKGYNVKSICPSIEEFHGSSEITKSATVVVTISPDWESELRQSHLYPTYMRICKDRFDGSTKRFVLRTDFNIQTCNYEDKYEIGFLKNDGIKFDQLTNVCDIPHWALGAKAALKDTHFTRNYAGKKDHSKKEKENDGEINTGNQDLSVVQQQKPVGIQSTLI